MKTRPEDDEQLNQLDLFELTSAIKSLADALTERPHFAVSKAQSAARNINTFLGSRQPCKKLTDHEATWSRCLHTCLRKYDDSREGVILYRMIAENSADPVWHAFVREIAVSRDARSALSIADATAGEGPTAWLIFQSALWIWHERGGMKAAVKEVSKFTPSIPAPEASKEGE